MGHARIFAGKSGQADKPTGQARPDIETRLLKGARPKSELACLG